MFLLALQTLVVAYLPGALVFRLPHGNRPARAALAAEERVFWAVVISLLWSLAVVMALAGAHMFTLDRLLMANGALAGLILVGWRQHLGYRRSAVRVSWSALVPITLVALGAWLYFPTAEYVMGGKDPGTYVNEGVQIAQRGALVAADPVIASVPPPSRDLFFPSHRSSNYYGIRFMGFFVRDPMTGDVVGQFPHLFPASIAIMYGLDGLDGARNAVALWGLLGLVAVYLTGARVIGRPAAAAAAGLLAINVIQIWFARYPNAEVAMQALTFAAILAFGRAVEGSRGFFGALAAALLGVQLFLRFDAVLAIAAFAAVAGLLPVIRARVGLTFVAVLIITSAVGLWYLANPMRAYSAYPLDFTHARGGWWLVSLGTAAVIGFRMAMRSARAAAFVQRWLPVLIAAVVVGLAIYAYFLREPAGRLALHDAMAFRTFAWYVTPWVLAAGVAAAGVAIAGRFWRDPAFFMTFVTFGVFFFYKTRIVPEHFWAARRFLAVILPGMLLCLAGLAAVAAERVRRREPATGTLPDAAGPSPPFSASFSSAALLPTALMCLTLAPVVGAFWHGSAPIRNHVEYAGLVQGLERLAGQLGDRDLLLVESRDAGSDLHALALPLAYIYDRQVLVLASAVPDKLLLEEFVTWANTQYDHVYFLGGGGTDLLTRSLSAEPIASDRFQVPEYDALVNAYPTGVKRKDFEFGMYEIRASGSRGTGPIDFRVGALDDLNVVRFHARERRSDSGLEFRWTGAQSYLLLLGVDARARELTIWMSSGGRPRRLPPPTVEVSIDGLVLGTASPVDAVQPYVFALPPDLSARLAARREPARVMLRVPTWNPAATNGGQDARDLGVVVTRVRVE